MGHKWTEKKIVYCCNRRITQTDFIKESICLPLEPTDSGDTKTKLVLEAGEVKELKLISKLLMYFADTSGMFKDISEIRKKYREYVSSSNWLNEFIQKHEGRDKS